MLVQLHWQDRADPIRTEFVGQTRFDSQEQFESWLNELIERRKGECPEGWCPLVCTEDSEYFVRAAGAPEV